MSLDELMAEGKEIINTVIGFLFGDSNDGSPQAAAKFGNAMNKAPLVNAEVDRRIEETKSTVDEIPALNVAGNLMNAQAAETTGEKAKFLGKAVLQVNTIPIAGAPTAGSKTLPITGHTKHGLKSIDWT